MADSNTKDFLDALTDFKSNLQDFSNTRIIQQANDQVRQIKASQENEANKRAQLQQISDQLVGGLAESGTPATTIQEIVKAFGPKQYATPQAAIQEAVLSGNAPSLDLAKQAAAEVRASDKGVHEQFLKDLQQEKNKAMLEAVVGKALGKKEKLDVGSRDQISAGFSMLDGIQDLNKQVDALGNVARLAGGYGGGRAVAQLAKLRTSADALKLQIIRANEKGVVSDNDRKYYEGIIPNLQDVRTLPSFKAGLEAFANKSKRDIYGRLTTLRDEGMIVDKHFERLNSYSSISKDPDLDKLPAGSVFDGIKSINGARYKVFTLPNGQKKKKKVD